MPPYGVYSESAHTHLSDSSDAIADVIQYSLRVLLVWPPLLISRSSAPISFSWACTPWCPWRHARCSGVYPPLVRASMS